MLKLLDNKSIRSLFVLLLTACTFACFQQNFFSFAPQSFFAGFQKDSEALVLGGMIAEDLAFARKGANLGSLHKVDGLIKTATTLDTHAFFAGKHHETNIAFSPYNSSYGIQAVVFSKIKNLFGLHGLAPLQSINSILLALVVISLSLLYRHIYDHRFAVIFLVTMLSSPWIVSFARNLFWMPFLWFLPALLAAMIYLSKGVAVRALLLLGIVAAVFLKSLAGYEYLSSITLFACSVFIVAPFFRSSQRDLPGNLRMGSFVFIACVLGFACALLVHANLRGESILDGLQTILEQDVKRRTYGDPALFDPAYKASLESSPLAVVKTYVTSWDSRLVAWLPGTLFKFLLALGVVGVCYEIATRRVTWQRDAVLLAFFFIVPASWFVLAKGHSYIHTHMNYVLWYFGFVQALIYIAYNAILVFPLDLYNKGKVAEAKDC